MNVPDPPSIKANQLVTMAKRITNGSTNLTKVNAEENERVYCLVDAD